MYILVVVCEKLIAHHNRCPPECFGLRRLTQRLLPY